jgi:hypothetical protein
MSRHAAHAFLLLLASSWLQAMEGPSSPPRLPMDGPEVGVLQTPDGPISVPLLAADDLDASELLALDYPYAIPALPAEDSGASVLQAMDGPSSIPLLPLDRPDLDAPASGPAALPLALPLPGQDAAAVTPAPAEEDGISGLLAALEG